MSKRVRKKKARKKSKRKKKVHQKSRKLPSWTWSRTTRSRARQKRSSTTKRSKSTTVRPESFPPLLSLKTKGQATGSNSSKSYLASFLPTKKESHSIPSWLATSPSYSKFYLKTKPRLLYSSCTENQSTCSKWLNMLKRKELQICFKGSWTSQILFLKSKLCSTKPKKLETK